MGRWGHETSTEVLAVGAGPVGLSLAIALARLSMRVRLIHNEDAASLRYRERRLREITAKYRASIGMLSLAPYGAAAEHALGRGDHMMLVRPDGHIGLVAPLDDVGPLDEYLRSWAPRVSRAASRSMV